MPTAEPPHAEAMVDIHCHLLPCVDDGARSWRESLEMGRMAWNDGIRTVIVTPHQLGAFDYNRGDQIRAATAQLQQHFQQHGVDVRLLPGADVRIEPELVERVSAGDVLTLGDHGRHVLLELPHEMYFSLDGCLEQLAQASITAILSHPERNQGLISKPDLIGRLVDRGCLMQITAGSLLGAFGPPSQRVAELMVERGWAHFVATDAHGAKARRPLLSHAMACAAALVGPQAAVEMCCHNPSRVAHGQTVARDVSGISRRKTRWFLWRQAG